MLGSMFEFEFETALVFKIWTQLIFGFGWNVFIILSSLIINIKW